jgi:uncharacterized protein YdaU (DUF1376 family)
MLRKFQELTHFYVKRWERLQRDLSAFFMKGKVFWHGQACQIDTQTHRHTHTESKGGRMCK